GSQITLTDPDTGAKTVLTHDGAPVVSKLDGKTLTEMAKTTEGVYIPAGPGAIALDAILDAHVKPIMREAAATSLRVIPVEGYPWLVLASIVLLLAALWVGAGIERPEAAR